MWGEIDSCIKPASPEPYEPHSGGTEDEDKMDQNASEPSNPCESPQTHVIDHVRTFLKPTFYIYKVKYL